MDIKHADKFIPTYVKGHDMLDVEPCYIEDRRVEQIKHRDSIVMRYTCEVCGRTYLAILPASDTCYLGSTCRACHAH